MIDQGVILRQVEAVTVWNYRSAIFLNTDIENSNPEPTVGYESLRFYCFCQRQIKFRVQQGSRAPVHGGPSYDKSDEFVILAGIPAATGSVPIRGTYVRIQVENDSGLDANQLDVWVWKSAFP